MFISKQRIEEDLEIARRAFKNPMGEPDEKEPSIDDSQTDFTFSEVVSLIGAGLWAIMPWALSFAVLLGIVGLLVTVWLR